VAGGATVVTVAEIVVTAEIAAASVEDLHRVVSACLAVLEGPGDLVARAVLVAAVAFPAVQVGLRADFPSEVVGLPVVFPVVRRGWVVAVATGVTAAVALVR